MTVPLGPGTDEGNLAVWDAGTSSWVLITVNPSTTRKFLSQVGNGSVVTDTSWQPIPPSLNLLQTVTPASAASFAITGLSGDTDEAYFIRGLIVKDATAGNITLLLNDDSGANYDWAGIDCNQGGLGYQGNQGVNGFPINRPDTEILASNFLPFEMYVYAKSGIPRRVSWNASHRNTGTPYLEYWSGWGEWYDTADSITEIDFVSSAGNIGGGASKILIYKA